MSVLRAVVFDVDFTLARPGPDLGPDGYRELGLRYGLDLDPARYEEARAAAFAEVKRHPELDHDEEIWVLFTERIIVGMGGRGDTYAAAVEMEQRLGSLGALRALRGRAAGAGRLRRRGLKIGLLSNSSRDLGEFVATTGSRPTPCSPRAHTARRSRTSRSSCALLELLEVEPREAVMVGDTLDDDVEGARAVGMQRGAARPGGPTPGSRDASTTSAGCRRRSGSQ